MLNRRVLIIAAAVFITILLVLFIPKNRQAPVNTVVSSRKEVTAEELYEQAIAFKKEGEVLKAKSIYQKIISEYADYKDIVNIQRELEDLNMRIIFSNLPTRDSVMHEVVSGDTLGKLAKKYGTTIELIKRSNNLSSDIIRIGSKLRIWTGKFNMLIDKSQNKLILRKGEEVIKVYDVSTGENNSTPVGEFKIVSKLIDPVWFNRGVVVPPESPQNVLGSRWLGFDMPGYGIHGTIEPETIGKQMTAGCIRMRNEDIEELYSIITYGTKVTVVD